MLLFNYIEIVDGIMKDKGKILDEQITTLLTNKDIKGIQELLGFEYEGDSIDVNERVTSDFLKKVMMKRDEVVYSLKAIETRDGLLYQDVEEELEIQSEEETYNFDIRDSESTITVVNAKGKGGQPMIFYYYEPDIYSNYVNRQMRTQSQDGKISRVERASCFSFHHREGHHAGIGYNDGSLLVTMKDKQGNKQAALYQDGIVGCKYFEYDKEGNETLCVDEEAVRHGVVVDGETYTVYDGFFEPAGNGYVIKKYNEGETIQDIKPQDIKRSASIFLGSEKKKIEDSLDEKTQEEVLGILQALDPIFKTMYNFHDIEDARTSKMEKLVTWLGDFSKRLKIDPKLTTQDVAVMSAMKRAVSKTIGKTTEAEKDLSTASKDDKQYEGEEYGDN